jgi:hypothetical protein
MEIRKYLRYTSLYHKAGILDDSSTGMEWMDSDFDSRTLREVTELSSVFEFLNELLTVLLIGTPNIMMLEHSLGVFDWKNNVLVSEEIFNRSISKILIYPLNQAIAYKDELGRITIELSTEIFFHKDVLALLSFHKLSIDTESDSELTTFPVIVKRQPVNEEIRMYTKFKIKNEITTALEIWYDDGDSVLESMI